MLRHLGGWHAIKITHAFPYFFCLDRADQNRRFCHQTRPKNGKVKQESAPNAPTKKQKKKEDEEDDEEQPKPSKKQGKNSFMFYADEIRPTLDKALTHGEKQKLCGERWRLLTPKEKEPYERMAAERKALLQQG